MPNSSSCSLKGIFIGVDAIEFLKISVVSVPEKGRANKELISFLSSRMRVAKSDFEIISGDTDRYKKIKISGVPELLAQKTETLLKGESQ